MEHYRVTFVYGRSRVAPYNVDAKDFSEAMRRAARLFYQQHPKSGQVGHGQACAEAPEAVGARNFLPGEPGGPK